MVYLQSDASYTQWHYGTHKLPQMQRKMESIPVNAKDIFSQSKNGELKVPKQTIEHHLKTTYSDECCSAPMPDMTRP